MLIYIVLWTGGYEYPSLAVEYTERSALKLAKQWEEDAEEGDYILVYSLNTSTFQLLEIPR